MLKRNDGPAFTGYEKSMQGGFDVQDNIQWQE